MDFQAPTINQQDEWDRWRTSLSAAMLESLISHAGEQHQGLGAMLRNFAASLSTPTPAGKARGWLVTATPLATEALRVVAARHASQGADAAVPVVHLSVERVGTGGRELLTRIGGFGATSFQPGGRGVFHNVLSKLDTDRTSLVFIDRFDRVNHEPALSSDLRELAKGRNLMLVRPHHAQRKDSPNQHGLISSLGMWMHRVDINHIDDEKLSSY